MATRLLIAKEEYVRLLDSSGNPILTENGQLRTTGSGGSSGTTTVSGHTFSDSRLLTDVSGTVTILSGTLTTLPTSSTTTVWNNEVFGDGSTSAVHIGTYHTKYNVYGALSGACTLILEFSDTSATWYPTNHIIMINTDGIVDGAFDDVVVPYIRFRKQTNGSDVCGTVLITGKGP